MLEHALHMRVLLTLGALALLVAVATVAFKLRGGPPTARLPAKAPAVAAIVPPDTPEKLADSVAPLSPATGALSLQPAGEHDAGASLAVVGAEPAVAPALRRTTSVPVVARPGAGAPRSAAAATKSKLKIGELGIASDNGRRRRVETPHLDEF
jgi:hypothetical protein